MKKNISFLIGTLVLAALCESAVCMKQSFIDCDIVPKNESSYRAQCLYDDDIYAASGPQFQDSASDLLAPSPFQEDSASAPLAKLLDDHDCLLTGFFCEEGEPASIAKSSYNDKTDSLTDMVGKDYGKAEKLQKQYRNSHFNFMIDGKMLIVQNEDDGRMSDLLRNGFNIWGIYDTNDQLSSSNIRDLAVFRMYELNYMKCLIIANLTLDHMKRPEYEQYCKKLKEYEDAFTFFENEDPGHKEVGDPIYRSYALLGDIYMISNALMDRMGLTMDKTYLDLLTPGSASDRRQVVTVMRKNLDNLHRQKATDLIQDLWR